MELAAAEMNTPGALKTEVREAQVPAQRKLIGRASSSLILEGVELTCQKGTSPHARMFALQFFVYRKAVVSLGGAKPKAGVIVRLEVREADGRPVSGCAAYVRREAIGRNQHKYSVTDDAPVTVECEPQQWGDQMDLLKQFVLDTVSAFPKMIEGDAKQFTLMALATKKVRFLGAALDGPLRRPAINGTVVPRWFLKVPASMATRAGAENSKRFLR